MVFFIPFFVFLMYLFFLIWWFFGTVAMFSVGEKRLFDENNLPIENPYDFMQYNQTMRALAAFNIILFLILS